VSWPRRRALEAGACSLLCAAVVAVAVAAALSVPSAGPVAPAASALPAGLTASEHTALWRAGAYGAKPVRLLVVGDSIALTLGMGLAVNSQEDYGVSISNHATLGCDLDPGTEIRINGSVSAATNGCELWRGIWPFLTASIHPEVVALGVGRWEVLDHYWDGRWVHVGEPVWDDHIESDLQQAIAIFHTFGARVVLFTMPYVDPADRQPDGLPWSEDTPPRTRAYNALVEQVASADPSEVSVIDVNRMLSPAGVYTATLAGVAVRWPDGVHVSVAGGELLQREILPVVARLGLQDETRPGENGAVSSTRDQQSGR
jgi:hypothetical protein